MHACMLNAKHNAKWLKSRVPQLKWWNSRLLSCSHINREGYVHYQQLTRLLIILCIDHVTVDVLHICGVTIAVVAGDVAKTKVNKLFQCIWEWDLTSTSKFSRYMQYMYLLGRKVFLVNWCEHFHTYCLLSWSDSQMNEFLHSSST